MIEHPRGRRKREIISSVILDSKSAVSRSCKDSRIKRTELLDSGREEDLRMTGCACRSNKKFKFLSFRLELYLIRQDECRL